MSINIPMKAPLTFGPGSIAWASFGYRAFPADGSPALTLGPGDVVRLAAGTETVWTVTETLRKVYFS